MMMLLIVCHFASSLLDSNELKCPNEYPYDGKDRVNFTDCEDKRPGQDCTVKCADDFDGLSETYSCSALELSTWFLDSSGSKIAVWETIDENGESGAARIMKCEKKTEPKVSLHQF